MDPHQPVAQDAVHDPVSQLLKILQIVGAAHQTGALPGINQKSPDGGGSVGEPGHDTQPERTVADGLQHRRDVGE